jgi:hypothetical protein
VLAQTHLASALTLLVLALTLLLLLALTRLVLAPTRLVLVLVRWLLALDSQAQQMAAKDDTPESTALPRQRAQWSQQSIAKASR